MKKVNPLRGKSTPKGGTLPINKKPVILSGKAVRDPNGAGLKATANGQFFAFAQNFYLNTKGVKKPIEELKVNTRISFAPSRSMKVCKNVQEL